MISAAHWRVGVVTRSDFMAQFPKKSEGMAKRKEKREDKKEEMKKKRRRKAPAKK